MWCSIPPHLQRLQNTMCVVLNHTPVVRAPHGCAERCTDSRGWCRSKTCDNSAPHLKLQQRQGVEMRPCTVQRTAAAEYLRNPAQCSCSDIIVVQHSLLQHSAAQCCSSDIIVVQHSLPDSGQQNPVQFKQELRQTSNDETKNPGQPQNAANETKVPVQVAVSYLSGQAVIARTTNAAVLAVCSPVL